MKSIRSLSECETLSQAIQEAMNKDNLRDAVGFICVWEEYRKNKGASPTEILQMTKESCYGACIASLLRVYGIDLDKIRI